MDRADLLPGSGSYPFWGWAWIQLVAPTGTPAPTNTLLPPTNTPIAPTATNTPLPPTPTNTSVPPTATPTSSDLIFQDGFESGGLTAWTSSATNGGALSASSAAALVGATGLRAAINSNTAIYVTDDTPAAEPRYRARFYFDPNSMTMASGNAHYIFYGYSGASTVVLRIEYRFQSPNRQIRAALVNNATTWTTSSWFTISDAPHFIEIDWAAATAAGANNGYLTLWIDGVQRANLTGSGQRHPAHRSHPVGSGGRHRHRHARHVLLRRLRVKATDLYRASQHDNVHTHEHAGASHADGHTDRHVRSANTNANQHISSADDDADEDAGAAAPTSTSSAQTVTPPSTLVPPTAHSTPTSAPLHPCDLGASSVG